MKKIITILLALLLLTTLSACSSKADGGTNTAEGKPCIVCTIFPQYDWVHQILGGEAGDFEVTLLLDSQLDLHNYQPSVDDIVKISTCDLFIYIGGESDEWVEDALAEATNEDMIVVNLLEALGNMAKEEVLVEGMEEEDEEEGDEEGEEETEYDEHIWLSLRNAHLLCQTITSALSELNPASLASYQSNLAAYSALLSALDETYQAKLGPAPTKTKTILVGDRFPFRYLVDDYGIDYYAAFVGCSAETEASFETIIFLANKVDELGLKTILVTESSDQAIARTIRDNTQSKDQQILVLNALQSVTATDINNGATYLSIMESNLDVLSTALQ
jgi:zinc transport system substrate-binding protein